MIQIDRIDLRENTSTKVLFLDYDQYGNWTKSEQYFDDKFFNKKDFFTGKNDESGNKDLAWYNEKGKEFIDADWYDGNRKTVS
jgi:hypothetical protein